MNKLLVVLFLMLALLGLPGCMTELPVEVVWVTDTATGRRELSTDRNFIQRVQSERPDHVVTVYRPVRTGFLGTALSGVYILIFLLLVNGEMLATSRHRSGLRNFFWDNLKTYILFGGPLIVLSLFMNPVNRNILLGSVVIFSLTILLSNYLRLLEAKRRHGNISWDDFWERQRVEGAKSDAASRRHMERLLSGGYGDHKKRREAELVGRIASGKYGFDRDKSTSSSDEFSLNAGNSHSSHADAGSTSAPASAHTTTTAKNMTTVYKGTGPDIAYKIDGNTVYRGLSHTVAYTISGDTVYEGTGATIAYKIDGNTIYKGLGNTIAFKIDGNTIYEGLGGNIAFKIG